MPAAKVSCDSQTKGNKVRILLPVDGSTFSKAAVAFIASRKALIQSQPDVELINVQYPVPPRAARAAGRELVLGYYKSEADKAVRPALAKLKRAGLQARVKYVVGNPGKEVSKIAATEAADLIVMGSHGRPDGFDQTPVRLGHP